MAHTNFDLSVFVVCAANVVVFVVFFLPSLQRQIFIDVQMKPSTTDIHIHIQCIQSVC